MAADTFTSRFARRVALYTSRRQSLKGTLLAFTSSLWFLLFLLVPLLIIVYFGFTTISYDLTISWTTLTTGYYLQALDPFGHVATLTFRTLLVSVVAALGGLAVAFPASYYLARVCSEQRRGLLVSLFVIPFWISFVVQVYAILPWVQRYGYIGGALDRLGPLGTGFADWLFGNFGLGSSNIVAPALIYIWLPFMILPLFTALLRIDQSLIEAAQDLGAGSWRSFRSVTFPLAWNGILTGTILVFITAFGSFVEPKLLAGQNGLLVGNFIQQAFLELGSLPYGAAASVVVLIPTIVLLYVYVAYAQGGLEEAGKESRVLALARKAWAWALDRVARKPSPAPQLANGGKIGHSPVRGPLERAFDRVSTRYGKRILQVYMGLALAAFYVPMIQVVIFSFNHDNNIINWSYFSLRWYLPSKGYTEVRSLFSDVDMMSALQNSIVIGLVVTTISLILGIPASLAIVRYRFGTKPFLNLMLYTGLMMPSIILGVAMLVFVRFLNDAYFWPYLGLNWSYGMSTIIVGHVTFCIPIVIVVLIVSLREFDRSIEEAAMNLGADEINTFFRVTLPNIMPGIISAALLSFTFSFSEVVVTLFLKGQGINTLPVIFWATLSKKIPTPELNAASTLILGLSILFVLVANKAQRGGTLYRF